MNMTLRECRLPLRRAFTTSHGTEEFQTSLIVELEQDGVRGYGESPDNSYFGASTASVRDRLESLRSIIEGTDWQHPEQLWATLSGPLNDCSFGLCAVDQAAHDLWGKRQGKPVHQLWGLSTEHVPVSDYTIGIDTIPTMIEKLNEVPGWPFYKIKLGTPNDLDIIRALREQTDAVFRVDANTAWTVEETIRNSHAMKSLGVEFIEQPLPADRWGDMQCVFRESALPVIADESCVTAADVRKCAGYFHGINIKLCKCGGLTPGLKMAREGRELGLKLMIGCMPESTVGISSIAQLLPLLDYADLDGAALLQEDIADGVKVVRGEVIYPAVNGCGVTLRG